MANILVAEDEPVSRAFLLDALQVLGHQVWTEADGESALRRASTHRFDLLLLDINLPLLRGPELLGVLRATPEAACATTPAIALSAAIEPAQEVELRSRGFAAVAGKPIAIASLGQLIVQALPAAPHPAVPELQDWNDAISMRATGGARPIMQSLRELMLRDLPVQRSLILESISSGEFNRARAETHRLRAACGFCGAERLLHTLDPLDRAILSGARDEHAIDAFRAAVDQLLEVGSG